MRFLRHPHDPTPGGRRFARHDHDPLYTHRTSRSGRLARFLEHGDLRLLVLHLISEKPRHGYEIIKAIEDLANGAYTPSPGVIYPTLTMLEELGQVESATEGPRKSFAIIPAGTDVLNANQDALNMLLAKIRAAQPREPAAPIVRAMENLRTALQIKFAARENPPELTRGIADILDAAVRAIEEF